MIVIALIIVIIWKKWKDEDSLDIEHDHEDNGKSLNKYYKPDPDLINVLFFKCVLLLDILIDKIINKIIKYFLIIRNPIKK